ncbi:TetR/AcrR family transcriptional regulator [Subtercola sp. PAMC28395]|uniref:TetR family transcriptional regulator n=1 Tax=Subtercola sp. PAMC28395 TaxID=2846775 RepID=UPI001C0B5FAF|nr:TetR family transcriptional regulator [Subtercola sp. PAMC28395]QWT24924.1 TetR/AcrR family transcriptional regulator [Subtercola sp. PAMC28395]
MTNSTVTRAQHPGAPEVFEPDAAAPDATGTEITVPETAMPGLRERKRLATSRSIQFAVLELSRDKGLDNVTVDEISRHADISPRTFFNYFPSKEAAVLGETPFDITPEHAERFLNAGPDEPVLDGLRALLSSMSDAETEDFEMHTLRKIVIRDYPQLLVQRISSVREFEVELTELVEKRLSRDARGPAGESETPDHPAIHERSRLYALIAIAAMRHAWGCWAERADTPPMPVLLASSFRELRTLL